MRGKLWYLTPLSTIFQLYILAFILFVEKTTDLSQVIDKLSHIVLYGVHPAMSGIYLVSIRNSEYYEKEFEQWLPTIPQTDYLDICRAWPTRRITWHVCKYWSTFYAFCQLFPFNLFIFSNVFVEFYRIVLRT